MTAILPDGSDAGRLQLEPPKLIFRGRERRVYEGAELEGVRAEGADLVLAGGARFTLDAKRAASWAKAILNPKGRIDKIGVKPGMRAAVMGVADAGLSAELKDKGAVPVTELKDLDLLFYAADSASELARIEGLVPALADKGALWVVSRKGKAAAVKDVEVLEAARTHGLVDNKVVAFSDTHTALRFVRKAPEPLPPA